MQEIGASVSRRAVSVPIVASHSRIVLSSEPDARRPSGNAHSAMTRSKCPSKAERFRRGFDVPQSDRLIVGARCKPAVRQRAQCGEHIRVPLQERLRAQSAARG